MSATSPCAPLDSGFRRNDDASRERGLVLVLGVVPVFGGPVFYGSWDFEKVFEFGL